MCATPRDGQSKTTTHWIIEQNELAENRWGLYAKHADWITVFGNQYRDNSVKDVLLDGDVERFVEQSGENPESIQPPIAKLTGSASVKVGTAAAWDASSSSDPARLELQYSWDVGDVLDRQFGTAGEDRAIRRFSRGADVSEVT